ncbi:coiled-coil domain-containing protein 117 isoform X1 [Pristis pectinata]|uniref:coiled-coil domain-containing protein 117 isoform X1 n=1 Tax=Pristis pectinata TaxID=685728 RepID=UPI00223D5EF4|nr:coiled-coil domain-containing protein 117 isoform X1 [Pristis pectinata]XP_051888163.1 coiled-coil domain-containing protein 117 isoform X1 [Pristis pectinata]XP_051888165.1 coiled-coil domain-containing protein 117 isoform X1 [Pristis pectinata]XP_051888166.1 coiled-coil domain-containing protein 117 isoform X1 [Pristis pectinata]XP_051888167.1 coiled-coil domain-containing protein 117 isoform X1 [Pristis pectinata]XP_051888168.1 coiled-coil domain-containing protein 117 isoform X1 [Pristi
MVMAHSLCYSSLAPSGRQLFQSPGLDIYGRNASHMAAHIQNPKQQSDCFIPEYCDPTLQLNGSGFRQADGINENMDIAVETPVCNPSNGMRTTANYELKHMPMRNEFCSRRKHKREQEEDEAPAQKKRLTEKMLDCLVTSGNISCSSWPCIPYPQGNGVPDVASTSWQDESTSQEFRVVENKESCMEVKTDPNQIGLERLKEIENRLVSRDDPEVDAVEISDMPVLVLSDSLREELRHGLEEVLPHTIMESLNRPCMELVLWRPPCEPLSDKLAALTEQRKSKHRELQCDPDLYKSTKLDSSLMCGDMNQTSTPEEDMEL